MGRSPCRCVDGFLQSCRTRLDQERQWMSMSWRGRSKSARIARYAGHGNHFRVRRRAKIVNQNRRVGVEGVRRAVVRIEDLANLRRGKGVCARRLTIDGPGAKGRGPFDVA